MNMTHDLVIVFKSCDINFTTFNKVYKHVTLAKQLESNDETESETKACQNLNSGVC